jgi:hypothetical protein
MPVLREGDAPPDEFLASWAEFLEECVKRNIKLSDRRWQRLKVEANDPCVKFALERDDTRPDSDFRVGLQLLVGLLDPDEDV